jgi:hypothetical protein
MSNFENETQVDPKQFLRYMENNVEHHISNLEARLAEHGKHVEDIKGDLRRLYALRSLVLGDSQSRASETKMDETSIIQRARADRY